MSMSEITLPEDKTLLILDDDRPFRERLARAMETRGFEVRVAETVREGIAMARDNPPAFAVVDLKLEDGNGWMWSKPCMKPGRNAAWWC
jgi:two-component system response regulator RegA